MATRSFPGEQSNGDTWLVTWHGEQCRIAMIDGLGHGPEAEAAAQRAREVLLAHPELSPEQSIAACHRALPGTRGAVALVIAIDRQHATLTYAGIGNVEARLRQNGAEQRLVSFRGILGSSVPKIRTFVVDLEPSWVLVVHSDGVSDRFGLEDLDYSEDGAANRLANSLLRQWGRQTDDATVLVASSGVQTS